VSDTFLAEPPETQKGVGLATFARD